ncbi:hypothetical protein [Pseudomonas sp. VI4.1]|uniref:hypothetical protein n=1 Tax=Pseudomonas sp. VI4.1 TaxID=1941346 RepID=UPI0010080E07|nr:hypothetical protein [Pseudomonas sp. VI4.1]
MDSVLCSQDEITEFFDSFGEDARGCNAVLLLPLDKTLTLLGVQFREVWSASREIRRGLPTFKTAQKMLSEDPASLSLSSVKKRLHMTPLPRGALQFAKYQLGNGYSVSTVVHWLGFLEHAAFSTPVVLEYWQEKLYQISDLSGVGIRSVSRHHDRYLMYTSAEVVEHLGCPASRHLMADLLSEFKNDDEIDRDKRVGQLMAADAFSVLLRLAAWLIAEAQIANWDWEVSENSHNSVHAAWAIPKWCGSAQSWSNPMEHALEKLAKASGWSGKKQKPVTYLGKVWAEAEDMPESSKIRLLRNWVQLKPSRPSFKSMQNLVRVCFDLAVKARHELPADVVVAYWQGACWFRFAETMAILVRDFQKDGWSTDLIASMMSVYESEYRTARALMGKPIND